MYIEELKEGDSEIVEHQVGGDVYNGALVVWDPKRVLVGAGARALFYPTLLYNVVRNKIQSEFRWWDRVDEAVQDYYHGLKKPDTEIRADNLPRKTLGLPAKVFDLEDFDDNSLVLITESDLDGYEDNPDSDIAGKNMLAEVNLACKVQFASQAAISRLSCLWLRCQAGQKVSRKKLSSSVRNGRLGTMGVDIHVY